MKNLATLLLVLTPACRTLGAVASVPSAVISDVGGAVEAVTPGEPDPAAKTAGAIAETGTTILTGNAALGGAAGVLVTGIAAFLLGRRKKAVA